MTRTFKTKLSRIAKISINSSPYIHKTRTMMEITSVTSKIKIKIRVNIKIIKNFNKILRIRI